MKPRRSDSKKWTTLPTEYLEQIVNVCNENFEPQIHQSDKFIAQGRIYQSEINLCISYVEHNVLKQIHCLASIDYDSQKENVTTLLYQGVDAIGSMFDQYFNDKRTVFPVDWTSFKIDEKSVYLKLSKDNPNLDRQANEILGMKQSEASDTLIQGHDEADELKALKDHLGLNEGDASDKPPSSGSKI